ncbi:hypothetical protein K502DRAFT_311916 [Neoconidiobolus thromboides FSU 785]|nr:hypothetical protein K502DRAFT_311916 [Neoconidiobolus thromboides FSU 785]
MSNNQRHPWRMSSGKSNENSYPYPSYENNNHSQAPSLPSINYPPIQPGPPPNIDRPINTQIYQPTVLPLLSPLELDHERHLRPSIHQPILSQNNLHNPLNLNPINLRNNPVHSNHDHNEPQHDMRSINEIHSPHINEASLSDDVDVNDLECLNVGDALTYLDRVKKDFQNNPTIYNEFLDIMKQFKFRELDTLGVIDRVASLFQGYPTLVIGFNAFLPPGFRIEISNDADARNGVKVIMPEHFTGYMASGGMDGFSKSEVNETSLMDRFLNNQAFASHFRFEDSNLIYSDPADERHQDLQAQEPPPMEDHDQQRKPPVEFNHAINYVNRIKNRFIRDPESYKQFLDILQLYSRETKPVQEIYAQVKELFCHDQELLNEFCQFLPGASQKENVEPTHVPILPHIHQPMDLGMKMNSNMLPPIAAHHNRSQNTSLNHPKITMSPHNTNRDFLNPPLGPPLLLGRMMDQNDILNSNQIDPHSINPASPPGQGYKKKRNTLLNDKPNVSLKTKKNKPINKMKDGNFDNQNITYSSAQQDQARQLIPIDDVISLEKIKRHIAHLPTYHEFLKVLSLYSQGIIDLDTLVETVENFIGNSGSLFSWFKNFIGYQPKPDANTSPGIPKPRLDLSLFKACGPSYRQLPKSETTLKCSGRDDLCNEVLNDDYASHPTWASEETVFVAHKKNSYEENLHKSEEDRFELDFNMETNAHTIDLLEPIAKQIPKMSPEAAAAFKLPPGLGGNSQTIYRRAIRKIYDSEADVVLDLLHDSPGTAVPIILKRLKQKDLEWREVKREWSKIWRDVDIKNYYRSLDYQSAQFKYNDRRNLNPRHLVTEIEAIKREDTDKGASGDKPYKPNVLCRPQLTFSMCDQDIHENISKLLVCLLRAHNGLTANEKNRIVALLKSFINSIFAIPFMNDVAKFSNENKTNNEGFDDNDSSKDSDNEVNPTIKRPLRGRRITNEPSPINVDSSITTVENLKEDITNNTDEITDALNDKHNEGTKQESLTVEDDADDYKSDILVEESTPITSFSQLNVSSKGSPKFSNDKKGAAFLICNGHIYSILRIYQVIYGRLEEVKKVSRKATDRFHNISKLKTVSRELEVQPKFEALADFDLSTDDCFSIFLTLTEKVLEGEIEAPIYEDCLRFMLGNNIYSIFTIDKTLNGFIKQVS